MRDIGDARVDLEGATGGDGTPPLATPARFASRPAMVLMAALILAVVTLGVIQRRSAATSGPQGVVQTSIAIPPGHALVAGPEITRDGQRIAFVSAHGVSRPRIYTRRLDEPELHVLEKTEEADRPIFSPDGRWIAYYAVTADRV